MMSVPPSAAVHAEEIAAPVARHVFADRPLIAETGALFRQALREREVQARVWRVAQQTLSRAVDEWDLGEQGAESVVVAEDAPFREHDAGPAKVSCS